MLEKSKKNTSEHGLTICENLRRWLSMWVLICLVGYGSAPLVFAQSGSIHPNAIEIDNNANLFMGDVNANIKNTGAAADWVKDSLLNTDMPTLINSVATGILANVTGAAGGTGHSNGVRIVDGIAGNDQDIFLTGGKENDTSTWNVGPGSVGSSKYDITQAYIANNLTNIFFGMERRGNNGTTAFDFEFNRSGTAGGYVPTRTVGDILVTFEMQGSGGSGSATPFFFSWNGSAYISIAAPAGVFSSINNVAIPPAPWGYVDSRGDWVLSPEIPRFEFAEAQVPLSVLGLANACGGAAFVQVRTRSSSTPTSDLKDTTKIFKYVFGGPSAGAMLVGRCDLQIDFDGSASRNTGGTAANLTYAWQLQKNSVDDGSGTWSDVPGGTSSAVSGTFTVSPAGRYRAVLTITESGVCMDSKTTNEVNVYGPVDATPVITPDCDDTFAYSATASGGAGGYTFAWTIYKGAAVAKTFTDMGTSSGTLDIDSFNAGANGDGTYTASVTVTDSQTCSITKTVGAFDVRHQLTASASKTNSAVSAANADSGFTATLTGSTNALAGDTMGLQWQRILSAVPSDISGATGTTLNMSMVDILSYGTTDSTMQTIQGDLYKVNRISLDSSLHAVRTINGYQCTADSLPVTVRAIKAIDP